MLVHRSLLVGKKQKENPQTTKRESADFADCADWRKKEDKKYIFDSLDKIKEALKNKSKQGWYFFGLSILYDIVSNLDVDPINIKELWQYILLNIQGTLLLP